MTGLPPRATSDSLGRRALRRLLSGRAADPADRPLRRAGVDPDPGMLVTPRLWVALG